MREKNGAVRRTAAEWQEIVERYEQSGLSQAAYCEQAGIAASTFQVWRRELCRHNGGRRGLWC